MKNGPSMSRFAPSTWSQRTSRKKTMASTTRWPTGMHHQRKYLAAQKAMEANTSQETGLYEISSPMIQRILSNAKLTDDEERAEDCRFGTRA